MRLGIVRGCVVLSTSVPSMGVHEIRPGAYGSHRKFLCCLFFSVKELSTVTSRVLLKIPVDTSRRQSLSGASAKA